MLIHLLAAFMLGHQTNPPGIPVLPSQAAFFSTAGATAIVEMRDAQGMLIPFSDTSGVNFSHVTVAFPAGTAVGLGWQITQTVPDGSHPLLKLPSGQNRAVVRMVAGTATESPVGTYDSSPGTGNGIALGMPLPDSGTPTVFSPGVSYTIAPTNIITSTLISGSTSVGIASQTAGLALDASLPTNLNPLALAIADIGGSGVTFGIEYRDASGIVIPLVDANGVSWSAVTVSIGASSAAGLSYLVLHTSPDGTHAIASLPSTPAYAILRCLTGTSGVPTASINTGGLTSGASGTGSNGCNTGYSPTASTPTQFYVGDFDRFGRVR